MLLDAAARLLEAATLSAGTVQRRARAAAHTRTDGIHTKDIGSPRQAAFADAGAMERRIGWKRRARFSRPCLYRFQRIHFWNFLHPDLQTDLYYDPPCVQIHC